MDTPIGLERAEVLQAFLKSGLGQQNVCFHQLSALDYNIGRSESALERMAELLEKLIKQAKGTVTLAATGGLEAQTMVMAIVGNSS